MSSGRASEALGLSGGEPRARSGGTPYPLVKTQKLPDPRALSNRMSSAPGSGPGTVLSHAITGLLRASHPAIDRSWICASPEAPVPLLASNSAIDRPHGLSFPGTLAKPPGWENLRKLHVTQFPRFEDFAISNVFSVPLCPLVFTGLFPGAVEAPYPSRSANWGISNKRYEEQPILHENKY